MPSCETFGGQGLIECLQGWEGSLAMLGPLFLKGSLFYLFGFLYALMFFHFFNENGSLIKYKILDGTNYLIHLLFYSLIRSSLRWWRRILETLDMRWMD